MPRWSNGPRINTKRGKNARGVEVFVHNCSCLHEVKDHLLNGCQGDGNECLCNSVMREIKDEHTVDTVINCECPHEVEEHDETGCFADRGECGCRGKRAQLPLIGRQMGFVPMGDVGGYGTARFSLRGCCCQHKTLLHGKDGCTEMVNGVLCPCTGTCVDLYEPRKPIAALPPPSNAVDDFDCCACESFQEAMVCTCECHKTDAELQRELAERDRTALVILATEQERKKREAELNAGKQRVGPM